MIIHLYLIIIKCVIIFKVTRQIWWEILFKKAFPPLLKQILYESKEAVTFFTFLQYIFLKIQDFVPINIKNYLYWI